MWKGTPNPWRCRLFLQLVATFGIAHEFDKEELRKLVLAVSWRRQIPKLCGALRLSEIMPDIVEELVNKGKQIEAVYFVYASGLSEKFPPVPLLKTYLKNSKKATLSTLKNGNNSAAVNEANSKELTALKAVIKCIEEHNLQSDFPPDTLQNRIAELEKKKAERKKSGAVAKSQNKRPRSNVGTSGAEVPPAKAGRVPNAYGSSNASDRGFYHRPSDMAQYPVAAAGVTAYSLPGQSNYDRSSQALYGSSYGGGNRSPLSKTYPYPADDMGISLRGSGSYNSNANYGNYHYGSSVPSAYQSSYLQ
uniref:FRIGIDA-like protein n=1 Tax=Wollemia nobilis TaxID=56998 RepID=A0A0C9QS21_9CONI